MKRILLSIFLLSVFFVGKTQTVLNEVYTEPGGTNKEFFEIYNSGVAAQSVDCFTLLHYFDDASGRGWYVIDFPTLIVGPKGYFVGAAANPFNTQSTTGSIANFNWNDAAFRSGATGGSITKWVLNAAGTGYTSIAVGANNNDVLAKTSLAGPTYLTLIYVNGVVNNGFYGGGPSGSLPAAITTMPNLLVDMNAACGDFNAVFSTIGTIEFVNSAPGNDNGFARTSDGKCGAWVKTSASVNHTPGVSNGSASGLAGALITTELLACNTSPGISQVRYSVTGVSGDVSLAADFPLEVMFYSDLGTAGTLDGADLFLGSQPVATLTEGTKIFSVPQTAEIILVYKTKRGCFDKIVLLDNTCLPLPVSLKSFSATRNKGNVAVKWETATESNNKGFNVQRNINGTWETVAFVFSAATGGNSSSVLSYSFTDANSYKGVSQYRIQQVDIDGKAKLSEIRSVKGEAMASKLLIYPNPSTTGKVSVVFDDNAPKNVQVSDMSGRVIRSVRNVSNNVNIEGLESGVYSIQVTDLSTSAVSVEKVIIKKR